MCKHLHYQLGKCVKRDSGILQAPVNRGRAWTVESTETDMHCLTERAGNFWNTPTQGDTPMRYEQDIHTKGQKLPITEIEGGVASSPLLRRNHIAGLQRTHLEQWRQQAIFERNVEALPKLLNQNIRPSKWRSQDCH